MKKKQPLQTSSRKPPSKAGVKYSTVGSAFTKRTRWSMSGPSTPDEFAAYEALAFRPGEKVEEFIDAMKTFGDIDVTRSGIVAVSMESRKLRLAPPVHAGANGAVERPCC